MAKIAIIGALPESLVNFRGDLIKTLAHSGHHVIAMAGPASKETIGILEDFGAVFISYPIQRSGMNPRKDFETLLSLYKILEQEKPDIILAYTIKPVIWGGIASRLLGISHRFHAMITGLGLSFQSDTFKENLIKVLVSSLFKFSLHRSSKVIFQNKDNQQTFLKERIIKNHQSFVVNGSGESLETFIQEPLPNEGSLVFLTIARLLKAKGLREFVRAAEKVKIIYPDVQFKLLGPEDPSPDGIPMPEVNRWHKAGAIEYCGMSQDVRPWLKQCHVFVLNSYHEGMPRSVLEAMATGRPIITTDVPGCRETVIENKNGYLIPKKNSDALSSAIIKMIENQDQLAAMGDYSRKIAEEKFDVIKINEALVNIMGLSRYST